MIIFWGCLAKVASWLLVEYRHDLDFVDDTVLLVGDLRTGVFSDDDVVAFAHTGATYPFFAAILGWLGVFLTGTDAGSNALFGSLQQITAGKVHDAGATTFFQHLDRSQAEVLICTSNSTGGVMGKMIDAQSIVVATAATNQLGREADIFKAVLWHSILLACIVGVITVLQAYVVPFTYMVPRP